MKALLVTDLDGTLLTDAKTVSPENLSTLRLLGDKGIVRAIATGRSVYSVNRVLPSDFPIDYLIFSSGAGCMEWRSKKVFREASLCADEVEHICTYLFSLDVDFMIHDPVPENHRFRYFQVNGDNSDFIRRIQGYKPFTRRMASGSFYPEEACQFVVVLPRERRDLFDIIAYALKELNVVMTTSPMDGRSIWVEIFPKGVSKAAGAEAVAERHGIPLDAVAAVGNDYNDLQLLSWAETSFTVSNAPEELKKQFPVFPSNNENGFTVGVEHWLRNRESERVGHEDA